MKSKVIIFTLIVIAAWGCKHVNPSRYLPGTWVTNEIDYVYDDTVITVTGQNLRWEFTWNEYEAYDNDTLTESGTYSVTLNGKKINFYSSTGTSQMEILESEETMMLWQTPDYGIGFRLRYELNKVQ